MLASHSRLSKFLIVVLLISFFLGVVHSRGQPNSSEHKLTRALSERLDSVPPSEKVRVIITLKKPVGRFRTQATRSSVRDDILAGGGKVRREYSIFDGMAAEIPASKVAALANNPNVELIVEDRPVRAFLTESVPLINADDVWNKTQAGTNITGRGQTVCVIDTGVDYNHSDLGGGKGPGFKVLGGYDFVNNNDDPMDDNGHGTHVAGIVAANGSLKGVAPDANIIAIKALDASGFGSSSDVIAGIDWCVSNANTYNITVISMSLGGGSYTSYCDNEVDETGSRNAINAAVAKNITVVVATGNEADYTAISSPACIQNATRVGATYDANVGGPSWGVVCTDNTTAADEITCFTNRGANFPDILLAPGALTNSTNLSNGYMNMGGTSMATPHVSGLIALLNQENEAIRGTNPSPGYLFDVINSTGVPLSDSETGRTYSRIDALAAYRAMDNISPSINFTAPTPQNNSNLSRNYVFVNITANEFLSTALLEWNGSNETMNSSGSWYRNQTGLVDGTYTYRVGGTDFGGNWNVTGTRAVNIDTTAPNITVHSPANTTTNDTTPLLNATFGELVNYTWYNVNGTGNSALFPDTQNLTLNLSELPEGPHNVTVYANDSFGNLNYTTVYFIVDTQPPNITITNPVDGETVKVFNNTIKGTVFDTVFTIYKVNITGNGTGTVEVDVTNGEFSYDISYVNGSNTIVVNATDGVGNTGSANVTVTVIKELQWNVSTNASGAYMWDVNVGDMDLLINLSTGNQSVNGTMNITAHALASDVSSSVMDVNAATWEGHLGKLFEINVSDNLNETSGNLTWAKIRMYYLQEEVDAAKLTEDSLALYWDNGGTWERLNTSWNWTYETGINTTDADGYSGYVWANLSHFSTYSVVGLYRADLAVGNITFSDSSPTDGGVIVINAIVRNTNATDANNFTVELLVDGTLQANNTLSVKSNSTNTTQFTWTSVQGTHNITIVADADNAINETNETNNNATEEITVNAKSSPPSGGGGGGVSSKTISKYIKNIAPGETGSVAFDSSKSPYVSEIAITVSAKVYNAKISLETLDKKPSPFFSDPADLVLSYLKITKSNIPVGALERADVKFKVEKDWLKQNDIDQDAVALSREVNREWERLSTVRLDEGPEHINYSAETPGFSFFVITGDEGSGYVEEAPVETEIPAAVLLSKGEEVPPAKEVETVPPTPTTPPKTGRGGKWIIVASAAILVLLAISTALYFKSKPKT